MRFLDLGKGLRRAWCSARPRPLHVARRECTDHLPPTERLGHMSPKVIAGKGGWVSPPIDGRRHRQEPRLGCEPERSLVLRNVEWLDPVGVSKEPQLMFACVPKGKGIHAAKLAKPSLAPMGDNVDQDFRVAICDE